MFVSGTSTHKGGEVAQTLMGVAKSASAVSRLNKTLTEQFEDWRSRTWQDHWRVLSLDGIYLEVRHGEKVDPTITVVINYSQDFIDTAKCHDLALSQVTQSQADIILPVAGGCGTGALEATDQQGVFGIGFDTDESYLYPSVITSAVKRVDTAVFDTITSFQHKQFTNNPSIFDLANSGVDYAKVSADVPEDAWATAENFRQQIIQGTLTLPTTIP